MEADKKDLKDMKLSELRFLYPGITTNSKAIFLEKIAEIEALDPIITDINTGGVIDDSTEDMLAAVGEPELPSSPVMKTISNAVDAAKQMASEAEEMKVETIEEARYKMQITDNIPKYILAHLYILQGCECTADAYATFRDTNFKMSRQFQLALIKWYREVFGENIRRSNCSSCWARRIKRFRTHLATKIHD
jgi:hypothetical protein